jgi:Zinc finger, C3HC4 type (RING finger)
MDLPDAPVSLPQHAQSLGSPAPAILAQAGPRKTSTRQRVTAPVRPVASIVTIAEAAVPGPETRECAPIAEVLAQLRVREPAPEQEASTPRTPQTSRAPPPESPPAPELPWASAPRAGDDSDCIVCLDADRTTRLVPCLHAAFCASCASALLATPLPVCPLCRVDCVRCEAAV